jgi:hypothetical protein
MRRVASLSGCEMTGEWLESISTILSTPTEAIMARCCAGEMARPVPGTINQNEQ